MGAVVLGDDDDAAGLLVEPMDDAGAQLAAGRPESLAMWKSRALTRVPRVAGVVGSAGAGVNHHAGGLVDDGEVVVLVEDVERNVLGSGVKGCGVGLALDLDLLAAVELELGGGDGSVDADLAGVDEQLHAGAADVRQGLGEVGVQAQAGGGGVRGEGADVVFEGGIFVEVKLGDGWGGCGFDAAGGAILSTHGLAAVPFGQHVLGGHGRGVLSGRGVVPV